MQEKNRQIIIKEEGSNEEDRQEEADVKKKNLLRMDTQISNDVIKMPKLGRFLSGQIVANTELQNKQDLPTVFGPFFSYNPHYVFCFVFVFAKRIARLPK